MVEADARAGAEAAASPDAVKHVCFFAQGQEYAVDIDDVVETMVVRPITRVFLTPGWLSGIINLRGDIVAVIDLAHLLGMHTTPITDDTRIVIVRDADDPDAVAGLVVDRMAELRAIDVPRLHPPPATLSTACASLLSGVATADDGRPVRVLDMRSLFASERLRAFRREGA